MHRIDQETTAMINPSPLRKNEATRALSAKGDDNASKRILGQARIVDGEETEAFSKPYMAYIARYTVKNTMFICGGVLIAPTIVLTAAHCVNKGPDLVSLGRHDLTKLEGHRQDIEKFRVVYSQLYDSSEHAYDYGLLFLQEPVDMKKGGDGLSLMKLNRNPNLPTPNQTLQILGWGQTESGVVNLEYLKEADVTFQTNTECGSLYSPWRLYSNPTVLCAVYKTGNICLGDSGGPLLIAGDAEKDDLLVGLTSFVFPAWVGDDPCDPDAPTGFANVARGIPWIDANVCFFGNYKELVDFPCRTLPKLTLVVKGAGRLMCDLAVEEEHGKFNNIGKISQTAVATLGDSSYVKTFYLYPLLEDGAAVVRRYRFSFGFTGNNLKLFQLWLGNVGRGALLEQVKTAKEATKEPFIMDIDGNNAVESTGDGAATNDEDNEETIQSSSPSAAPNPIVADLSDPASRPANGPFLQVMLTFDGAPEQTGWTFGGVDVTTGAFELLNDKKTGSYPSSEYANQTIFIYLPFRLRKGGTALVFSIVDSERNGICCGENGNGRYELAYVDESNVQVLIGTGGSFKHQETTSFFVDGTRVQTKVTRSASVIDVPSSLLADDFVVLDNFPTLLDGNNETISTSDVNDASSAPTTQQDSPPPIALDDSIYYNSVSPSPAPSEFTMTVGDHEERNEGKRPRAPTMFVAHFLLACFLLGWACFFLLLYRTNNI